MRLRRGGSDLPLGAAAGDSPVLVPRPRGPQAARRMGDPPAAQPRFATMRRTACRVPPTTNSNLATAIEVLSHVPDPEQTVPPPRTKPPPPPPPRPPQKEKKRPPPPLERLACPPPPGSCRFPRAPLWRALNMGARGIPPRPRNPQPLQSLHKAGLVHCWRGTARSSDPSPFPWTMILVASAGVSTSRRPSTRP